MLDLNFSYQSFTEESININSQAESLYNILMTVTMKFYFILYLYFLLLKIVIKLNKIKNTSS